MLPDTFFSRPTDYVHVWSATLSAEEIEKGLAVRESYQPFYLGICIEYGPNDQTVIPEGNIFVFRNPATLSSLGRYRPSLDTVTKDRQGAPVRPLYHRPGAHVSPCGILV